MATKDEDELFAKIMALLNNLDLDGFEMRERLSQLLGIPTSLEWPSLDDAYPMAPQRDV